MKENDLLGDLVQKSKKNDNAAFTKLILIFKNDLYKIAKMRLNCEDDIEDAVQDTIIQAYKNIKKLRNNKYFKTWIIKILINNCNKTYKKLCKEKKLENIEELTTTSYYISDEENIKNLDFYILIKNLNYKERTSLTLYYLMEFTTKEISKILKEPEPTIRSRLSRAKLKLKKMYEEDKNEQNRKVN